jgi:hypothetical protein
MTDYAMEALARPTQASDDPGRTERRDNLYEPKEDLSERSSWAMDVAKRRGLKRAKVALARKLGTVLHRMWVDGTDFRWGKEMEAAA